MRQRILSLFLFDSMRVQRKRFLILSLCILSLTIGRMLQAKLTQKLVDAVSTQKSSYIMTYGILLGFLCIACVGVTAVKAKVNAHFTAKFCESLKVRITKQILICPYQKMLQTHAGDLLKTANLDTETVCNFVSQRATGLVAQVVMLIGAYIYLLGSSPLIGVLTFCYTPFGMFITYQINIKMGRYYPVIANEEGRALSIYEQIIGQIPVIRSFHMEKVRIKQLKECYETIFQQEKKASYYNAILQTACSMESSIPKLIYLIMAMVGVQRGVVTLGEMIAIYEILNLVIAPTVYFPFLYDDILRTKASWKRIEEVCKLSESVDREGILNYERERKIGHEIAMSLTVDQLSFAYESSRNIIDGITFHLTKPGIYVMEGESGKGKTTLIDLCAGLLTPDAGRISMVGNVCTMTQNTYLFHGTVLENLTITRLGASMEEVQKAIEYTHAEFVWQLPQGIHTMVGDGGVELSGGQKQRIGLIRMLLSNASILLLDEPTSALDEETEQVVARTLQRISTDHIILMATHRSAMSDLADGRIAV